MLFSFLSNELLSRHVVVNPHLGNLNFLETYRVGSCDGHCSGPYGSGLNGYIK